MGSLNFPLWDKLLSFYCLSLAQYVLTYIVPVVVVHTAGGCIAVCSANRVVWYNRVVNKVVTVMGFSERALLRLQERNNILIQVICLGCFVLKLFT